MHMIRKPPDHDTPVSVPLESLIRAKEERFTDQCEALGRILASMEGYPELQKAPAHIQKQFIQAGYAARRMAAFDAAQFRHLPRAYRAAAQTAENVHARIERYQAVDLSKPDNQSYARDCYEVTTAAILTFWDVLGAKEQAELEAAHGDPRRI